MNDYLVTKNTSCVVGQVIACVDMLTNDLLIYGNKIATPTDDNLEKK